MAQDFLDSFTRGMQVSSGIRDRWDARKARKAEETRTQQLRQTTGDLMGRPIDQRLGPQDIAPLVGMGGDPSGVLNTRNVMRKNIMQEDSRAQAAFRDSTGRMLGAIHEASENPEVQTYYAQKLISAAQQAGVDVGPFQTPEALLQNLPAVMRVWGDFDKQLSQQKAQAEIGKTKAETANVNSTIAGKEIEQKYLPLKNQAELDSKAATTANTNVDTELKQLDLKIKRTVGNRDPAAIAKGEDTLRQEYQQVSKGYRLTQDAYERIQAGANDATGASDMSLIFSYMKMLDPGSTVREGEFATAENAGGIPDKVSNMYNKAIDGQFLSPKQRKSFLAQSGRLFDKATMLAKKRASEYAAIAKRRGLDVDNIIMNRQKQAAPDVSKAEVQQNIGGVDYFKVEGKWYRNAP